MPSTTSRQARYWLGTINNGHGAWEPPQQLPEGVQWLRGQQEIGEAGNLHWQLFVAFKKKVRIGTVKTTVGNGHWEPSRSEAAEEYVWKEDTRVAGTQFELGRKSLQRNSEKDWEAIKSSAQNGRLEEIPADVYVRCYSSLTRIAKDNMRPSGMERRIFVLWGPTGTGKSHRAWAAAGLDAYPKDPKTKYWDGYTGQENVVIDEFRGGIDIAHVLRWFDKYPVCVENKYGGLVYKATKIWITSNLDPNLWYPELDEETRLAFMRRLQIFHVTTQDQEIEFI